MFVSSKNWFLFQKKTRWAGRRTHLPSPVRSGDVIDRPLKSQRSLIVQGASDDVIDRPLKSQRSLIVQGASDDVIDRSLKSQRSLIVQGASDQILNQGIALYNKKERGLQRTIRTQDM